MKSLRMLLLTFAVALLAAPAAQAKYLDDENDLIYYGYRYYNPSTGRWLSRDPINEKGFQVIGNLPQRFARLDEKNLYCLLGDDSLNKIDKLGLAQGTFSLKNTTMVLNPDDLALRDGAKNPVKAFDVKYIPEITCPCSSKNIVLVQAVKNNHTWTTPDPDPKFDAPNAGNLPPAYGGRHVNNLEYLDSPYYDGFWSLTWSFEVCALCRNGATPEKNFGCHTFKWHNEKLDHYGDFSATEPGELWKDAMAAWTKLHPSNPDK